MNGIRLTAAQERQLRETLQHTHDVRQYREALLYWNVPKVSQSTR
jgi:hypothetical protein